VKKTKVAMDGGLFADGGVVMSFEEFKKLPIDYSDKRHYPFGMMYRPYIKKDGKVIAGFDAHEVDTQEKNNDKEYTYKSLYNKYLVSNENKYADGGALNLLADTSGAGLQSVGGTTFSSADLTSHLDFNANPMFKYGGMMAKGGLESYFEKKKYKYEDGGFVDENTEMLMSQIKEIKHHAEEIQNLINNNTRVEAWVVAKAERSATDLSDITHYIDGRKDMFCCGGVMAEGGAIENQYKNRSAEDIWNSETPDQRLHFLIDHDDRLKLNSADVVEIANKSWNDLDFNTQVEFTAHKIMGQYAQGGRFNTGRAWTLDHYQHNKEENYEVPSKDRVYADGGGTDEGIDLFEDYQNIPPNVQKVLDKYEDAFMDGDYKGLEKAHKELGKIGYEFEYYLDGQAYDLRPIGTKGKSENYAKGGKTTFDDKVKGIAKRQEGTKVPAKYQNEYGKVFSHDESIMSAMKIVGAMRKKEMAKKSK
jgi:hypothetical protein